MTIYEIASQNLLYQFREFAEPCFDIAAEVHA